MNDVFLNRLGFSACLCHNFARSVYCELLVGPLVIQPVTHMPMR